MKLVSCRGIFYLRMKVTQNDLPSMGRGDDVEEEKGSQKANWGTTKMASSSAQPAAAAAAAAGC